MKKANIFGGIKVWGRFNFNLPRANFKEFFRSIESWNWAAWFWFTLLTGLTTMGTVAVIVA